MSFKSRNFLILALIYATPFLLVIFTDHFVLHRSYFSTPTDTVPTSFGMGLNWVALRPNPFLHHPGYFFQQISGLLVLITGLNPDNLGLFNAAGLFINFIFLTLSALWMAYLAHKLNLKRYLLFIIGAITASMPTIALYSGLWTLYFPCSVMAVPMVLSIYNFLKQKENNFLSAFLPFAVLGFLMANLFLTLFLVLAAGAGLLAFYLSKDSPLVKTRSFLSGSKLKVKLLLTSVLALFLLSIVFGLLQPKEQFSLLNVYKIVILTRFLIAAALSLVFAVIIVFYLIPKCQILKSSFFCFVLPLLIGWLIGVNLMFPFWGISAKNAFFFKGTWSQAQQPSWKNWTNLEITPFLFSAIWHWFLIFILIVAFMALTKTSQKQNTIKKESLFIGVFCLTAILLNIIAAADVALKPYNSSWLHPRTFGQVSRYFQLAVAPLALGLVWVFNFFKKPLRVFVFSFCFLICLFSFWQYFDFLMPTIKAENLAEREIQNIMTQHLKKPNTVAVCARTVIPAACEILYAYNNCRNHLSVEKISKNTLQEGRIIYGGNLKPECKTSLGDCLSLKEQLEAKEILIVAETSDSQFLPSSAQLIWQHPDSQNSVWLIKR